MFFRPLLICNPCHLTTIYAVSIIVQSFTVNFATQVSLQTTVKTSPDYKSALARVSHSFGYNSFMCLM